LSAGAFADVVAYRQGPDIEAMLREPARVFKRGTEVARAGKVVSAVGGATQVVRPSYDRQIEKRLRRFFDDHISIAFDHFPLRAEEIAEAGGRFEEQPCRSEALRP
jgi:formylmethanofuran dehydrogenase subunit A